MCVVWKDTRFFQKLAPPKLKGARVFQKLAPCNRWGVYFLKASEDKLLGVYFFKRLLGVTLGNKLFFKACRGKSFNYDIYSLLNLLNLILPFKIPLSHVSLIQECQQETFFLNYGNAPFKFVCCNVELTQSQLSPFLILSERYCTKNKSKNIKCSISTVLLSFALCNFQS